MTHRAGRHEKQIMDNTQYDITPIHTYMRHSLLQVRSVAAPPSALCMHLASHRITSIGCYPHGDIGHRKSHGWSGDVLTVCVIVANEAARAENMYVHTALSCRCASAHQLASQAVMSDGKQLFEPGGRSASWGAGLFRLWTWFTSWLLCQHLKRCS